MLLPLVIGLALKAYYGDLAVRVKPGLDWLSNISLILLVCLITVANIDKVLQVFGTRGILAGILFIALGLGTGWLLGGRDTGTKSVMALGTGQRNIAAALVVASQSFSDPKVVVMVIVVAIVGLVVLMPLSRAMANRRYEPDLSSSAHKGGAMATRGSPSTFAKQALVAFAAVVALFWASGAALAQDDSKVLAEELANPLTVLISVPFFGNYNGDVGPEREGSQWFMNIQPVVPIELNPDWHVISRTILPVMFNQNDIFRGAGSQSGLRDTTEGLYFSPSRTFNGFTLGAGPIFLLPTGTDELLGAGKWGAGPTGVLVWQGSGWTVGILANHIWSFAGDTERADFDQTVLCSPSSPIRLRRRGRSRCRAKILTIGRLANGWHQSTSWLQRLSR